MLPSRVALPGRFPDSGACASKPGGPRSDGERSPPGRGDAAGFARLPGYLSGVAVGRCWRGSRSAPWHVAVAQGSGPVCPGRCGPRSNPRGQWQPWRRDARAMETRLPAAPLQRPLALPALGRQGSSCRLVRRVVPWSPAASTESRSAPASTVPWELLSASPRSVSVEPARAGEGGARGAGGALAGAARGAAAGCGQSPVWKERAGSLLAGGAGAEQQPAGFCLAELE